MYSAQNCPALRRHFLKNNEMTNIMFISTLSQYVVTLFNSTIVMHQTLVFRLFYVNMLGKVSQVCKNIIHHLILLLHIYFQVQPTEHYWSCPTYRVQRHGDLLRDEIMDELLSNGNYAAGIRTTDRLVKSRTFYP